MGALLNLVVLQAARPEALVRFYEALGLHFARERHGRGPDHYSAACGEALLEIYPASAGENTAAMRIGFAVDDVEQACRAAREFGRVLKEPSGSEWGVRAVLADPAGHTVELTQRA